MDFLSRDHKDEFEADLTAQLILLQIDRTHSKPFPIACGGICFLAVHLMVQKLWSKVANQPFDEQSSTESHPPSRHRINLLANFLKERSDEQNYANTLRLFMCFERFIDLISQADVEVTSEGIKVSLKMEDSGE